MCDKLEHASDSGHSCTTNVTVQQDKNGMVEGAYMVFVLLQNEKLDG
jgi:hypothetical protein